MIDWIATESKPLPDTNKPILTRTNDKKIRIMTRCSTSDPYGIPPQYDAFYWDGIAPQYIKASDITHYAIINEPEDLQE